VITAGPLYTNFSNSTTQDSLGGGSFAFTSANAGSGDRTITTSGVTVTDGNSGLNYNVTYAPNTTSTINPFAVNLTGTRTYDGTTTLLASDITLGSLVNGETLGLTTGSGSVASKHVGSAKALTLGALTLADNTGLASNYTFIGGTQTADITAVPLTIATSALTKVYDGSLTAAGIAVVTSGTVLAGDSIGGGSFSFTNANVGSANRTVTASGVTVTDGNGGNNYSVTYANNTSSTISPASLTISTNNVTKNYDGTTSAQGTAVVTLGTLYTNISNSITQDSLGGGSFAFTSANAGSGDSAVTTSGVTLTDGNSGNNYNVTYANNTTSTINPFAVNLTGTRAYDGTTTLLARDITLGSLVNGETLGLTGSGSVASKHIGTAKAMTLGTLTFADNTGLASNYAFTGGTPTANVTAAPLTITTSALTKIYDGSLTAAGTAVATLGTVFSGDSLSGGSFGFTSANTGSANRTVTASGVTVTDGNGGNNYSVTYANNTGSTISPANLTISTNNVTKTYDGTTSALGMAVLTAGTLYINSSNMNAQDSIGGGTFAFNSANAGSADRVITTSGVTVTDGNSGSNYNVSYANNTSSTITPAVLTIDAVANDKNYDGSNVATINSYGFSGLIGPETVVGTNTGALFIDKNAGSSKAVTISGVSLIDGSSGGLAANYSVLGSAATTATIAPAVLSLAASANDKMYDRTEAASLIAYGLSGFIGSETVTAVNSGSVTFADKNVGTGKAVTINGIGLIDGGAGGLASNYSVASSTIARATISPVTLTVAGVVAVDKIYDGSDAATLNTFVAVLTGELAGDDVSVGTISGTFATKDVGTDKAVVGSAFVLAGVDGGNYNLVQPTGLKASITPRMLTVTAVGADRVYDGTTTGTAVLSDDRVSGDLLSVAYNASYLDKNVGSSKFMAVSGINLSGTDAVNYVPNTSTGTFGTVTALTLGVSAIAPARIYDGTRETTVSLTDNRINGDVLNVAYADAAFSDKNVGVGKRVSVNGVSLSGIDALNYTASTSASTTATISAATLAVSVTGTDKVYDATTNAVVSFADNRIAGDQIDLAYTTVAFADKNVGVEKIITTSGFSLSGADAGNYTASANASATATITAATLSVSATGVDKVYDANTNATVVLSDDRLGSDALTLAYSTAAFSDKNVGVAKDILVSGFSFSGVDAGNYVSSATNVAEATITAATLVVSATAVDKVYDATTNAVVTLADNRISGDVFVTAYTSSVFSDKHVGADKAILVSGISSSGADAGNYLSNTSTSSAATITAAALTVGATAVDKIYDATTNAVVSLTDNRFSGDVFATAYRSAVVRDKNVGAGKDVTIDGISLSGTDAGNYLSNTSAGSAATITAAALTVGATAVDKIYDATTNTVVSLTDNRISGDIFDTAYSSAVFSDKNVGIGKGVMVGGIGLSGTDAGNYTANLSAMTTATISAASLVVNVSGVNREYDATTNASVTLADNRFVGDKFDVSHVDAEFIDKNVGENKAIAVNGISLAGGDARNYVTSATGASNANITAATLIVTASGEDKIQDGNDLATVTLQFTPLATDVLNLDFQSASFDSPLVGTNKLIRIAGINSTGLDANNYRVATDVTASASITADFEEVVSVVNASVREDIVVTQSQTSGTTLGPKIEMLDTAPGTAALATSANVATSSGSETSGGTISEQDSSGPQAPAVATEAGSVESNSLQIKVSVSKNNGKILEDFSFTLPQQILSVSNSKDLKVSTPSGEALPDWVEFDLEKSTVVIKATESTVLPFEVKVSSGTKDWVIVIDESVE
jgi:hypothetical protein